MLRTRLLGALALTMLAIAVACSSDLTGPPRGADLTSPSEHALIGTATNLPSQLLACPTFSEMSVSGVLSADGDSLTWNGNTVIIPAGAIPQATRFTVTRRAGSAFVLDIHADGYEHYQFLKPITVILSHADCPSRSSHLSVVYVDAVTGAPLEWMGGVADTLAQTVTFTTSHLSGYAVAE